MFFRSTFTALAVSTLLCATSQAAIIGPTGFDNSWAEHSFAAAEAGSGVNNGSGALFTHEWRFNLTSTADGSASIIANPLVVTLPGGISLNSVGISGGTLNLFRDLGATGFDVSDSLIGTSLPFSSTGASVSTSYSNLVAGDYFYRIQGRVSGISSGNYNFNSVMRDQTASVPLPGTSALLTLAGVGIVLRSRKLAILSKVSAQKPAYSSLATLK